MKNIIWVVAFGLFLQTGIVFSDQGVAVSDLSGSWVLRATVVESKGCEGGGASFNQRLLTVEKEKCFLNELSLPGGFKIKQTCEVDGNTLRAIETFDVGEPLCEMNHEARMFLNYDKKANNLTGEETFTVSGTCPEGVREMLGYGCRQRGNVVGTRHAKNTP